jgi:TRAP-type C4-dicarboxylate transport system permease small subunit
MLLKRLSQIELAICVLLLAFITGLVFVAALMRWFGHPLIWSVDMAQLLFIWLCMFGATRAMREKSHLGMEVLTKYLPYMSRLWLELVCSLVTLGFLGIISVLGFQLAWLNRARQFGDSGISYAWVTGAVPVGCILLGIALVYNMVRAWQGRDRGKLVYTRTAADKDAPVILEL